MKMLLLGLFACFSLSAAADDIKPMLLEMAKIEATPTLLSQKLEQGRERATLCVHCHGEDGNSKRTYIPNLANQNAEYLFTQFEHFANGVRSDYVMSKLAKGLTTDDRIAVALYFSRQAVVERQQPVADSQVGKQIYDSSCFACHGSEGTGSAQYPHIAGQPYEFLYKTLMRFHDNAPDRRNSPMLGVVRTMKEDQLQAVAAYVANMPTVRQNLSKAE